MPTASVVLCVRNGAATLDRQLAALSAQDYQGAWELVLVDNASTDGTRRVAEQWVQRLPAVQIVDEPRVGINHARNRGIRAARAAVVVLCDADDEVAPEWLGSMIEALGRFDVVGGALDPDRLDRADSPRVGTLQRDGLPTVFGKPYSVGASLGFTRQVFDAIGGLDETFVLGSDEVDFCLRAQYAGFSIGFAPSAIVHYRVRDTARGVMRQRFSYGRGHQRLVAKHARLGHIRSRPLQRWKVVAVGAVRLARDVPDALHRRTRLQYLAAVAYLAGRVVELAHEALPVAAKAPDDAHHAPRVG